MVRLILALLLISSFAAAQPLDSTLTYPLVLPGKRLVLPTKIEQLLAAKFPDYRVPTAADYRSHRTRDSLDAVALGHTDSIFYVSDWYYTPDHAVPWATWGDYNGDHHTDVALIIIPKDEHFLSGSEEESGARTEAAYDSLQKLAARQFTSRRTKTMAERMAEPHANMVIFQSIPGGYEVITPWKNFPLGFSNYILRTYPPGFIPPLWTGAGRTESIAVGYDSIEWMALGTSSCRFYWDGAKYLQVWTGD